MSDTHGRFRPQSTATQLRPDQILTTEQLAKLRMALAVECGSTGDNPNEHASPMHCEALERWAAETVLRYAMVMEIMAVGRGVRVWATKGGSMQVGVTQTVAESVVRQAAVAGVALSQRVS